MKLRHSASRGFTLFEVILASVIFVVLAGGVYFTVSTAISAASEAGQTQLEARKTAAFVTFLRDGFLNLPANAEISVDARSRGSQGHSVELVIKHALGAFATGPLGDGGGNVVLATIPNGKGLSSFSLARFPEKIGDGERARFLDQADWLPVLENIQYVRWRFWDSTTNRLVETWERGAEHPKLVELTFKIAGEPESTCLFWLPPLIQSAAATLPSTAWRKA